MSVGTPTYPTAAVFESYAVFTKTAHGDENQDSAYLFLKCPWGSSKIGLEVIPLMGYQKCTFGEEYDTEAYTSGSSQVRVRKC
jgi:hypothetical protein